MTFLKDLIEDKEFIKKIIRIALPITIQNFIASSLNMVDTIIIGGLGETQIAAVGIANQYFFLFSLIAFGLLSGCGIFIAQFWGKKDIKNIRKFLGLGLAGALLITLVFTAVALFIPKEIYSLFNRDQRVIGEGVKYLRIVSVSYIFTIITYSYSSGSRCVEEATTPMVISAIAIIINGVLDYIFVYGYFGIPAMGVSGAALATVIARAIEMVLIIACIYKTKGALAASLSEMVGINREFIKNSMPVVMPVVLNEACWGVGNVCYVIAYGKLGTEALAAVQICTTIQNMFFVITLGMANAAAVMIGNSIGSGNEEDARMYGKRFGFISMAVGLIMGGILFLNTSKLLSLFNISHGVYRSALYILYIIASTMFIKNFNTVFAIGILQGGGDSSYSFKMQMITMWTIGVPLAFIGALYLKLPVYAVVGLVCIEELIKIVISIKRLFTYKWVKNVTECVA